MVTEQSSKGKKRGTKPRPVADRFWPKVQVGEPDACWPWLGYCASRYGRINVGGKSERVHRVVYALLIGPIPDGLCVLHRCDNPPCVNPAHLFLGTNTDNWDDMREKGRASGGSFPGERHPHAKLSWAAVREIRSLYLKVSGRELAQRFAVTVDTIRRVQTGTAWKETAMSEIDRRPEGEEKP